MSRLEPSALRSLEVGAELPPLVTEPISRLTLALYAGASGDHNPMHVDIDFARRAGAPDVFAHGMLAMAYLGRMLTSTLPLSALRSFGVRFAAVTRVGDVLICRAKVAERVEAKGEPMLRLELTATDQQGEVKLSGDALIATA
jgi:acyl dehydratase